MEPASWFELGAAFACLLLVALASATEAALAHISRHKLRQLAESGRRGVRRTDRLLDAPRAYASAMTVLQTFATATYAVLLCDLALRQRLPGEVWLALAVAAPTLLLLGHGLPRALARRGPETTATVLSGFAWLVTTLARPLTALYEFVLQLCVRLVRRSRHEEPEPASEEDLHALINGEYGNGFDGVIEEEEREMIDAILQLEERTARDIMVPRLDIVAVPEGAGLPDVVETIERAGHSRVPVYSESIDSIVGVLYAKDLLRFVPRDATAVPLESLTRPAYIVPEAKRVDDLLRELRASKVHMAIVVDEYGGTAGVVTIEDILEEIVGEIDDEYDLATTAPVQAIGEDEVVVDGRIGADEVSELLDLDWSEEEHNTLSGLVQRELGRLPDAGEEFDFGGAHISVLAVDGHRIKQLRVEKHTGIGANGEGERPVTHDAQSA